MIEPAKGDVVQETDMEDATKQSPSITKSNTASKAESITHGVNDDSNDGSKDLLEEWQI